LEKTVYKFLACPVNGKLLICHSRLWEFDLFFFFNENQRETEK